MDCVRNIELVVSRLVKGRLSDHVKTVRVPVQRDRDNITLVLPCDDMLPYTVQVATGCPKNVSLFKEIFQRENNEVIYFIQHINCFSSRSSWSKL